jgi:hypothetical protein
MNPEQMANVYRRAEELKNLRNTDPEGYKAFRKRQNERGAFGNFYGRKMDPGEGLLTILGLGGLFAGLGALGGAAAAGGGGGSALGPGPAVSGGSALGPAASGEALGSTAGVGSNATLGNTAGLLSGGSGNFPGAAMESSGAISGVTPSLASGAGGGSGWMKSFGNFFGSDNIGDGQFTMGDINDSLDIANQVNSLGGEQKPLGGEQTGAPGGSSLVMNPEDEVGSNKGELDIASEQAKDVNKPFFPTFTDNLSSNVNPQTMMTLALLQQATGREVALPGLLALTAYQTMRDRQ